VNLVDANVLLSAINEADDKHEPTRVWLDGALSASEPIAFSWIALLAFIRLVTKVGMFPNPLPVEQAFAVVRAWLGQEASVVLEPGARHLEVLAGLLTATGSGGNLTNDAHLAALAVEHDATIVTYDSDFARFPGVRWRPPTG
jgi:hypothetical protein